MPINLHIKFVLLTPLCLGLFACSNDNSDLKKYIFEVNQRTAKPIEPLPEFAPLPVFKYPDNDTRRNPFKPATLKNNDEFAPDQKRKKEVLESYPLDTLKFVGTLKEGHTVWALIKLPDDTITRVGLGRYLGQNYGRIVSIKDDAIKLEETAKEGGKWVKHTTTLNIFVGQ